MKKYLLLVTMLVSLYTFGQRNDSFNKWSVGYGLGTHAIAWPHKGNLRNISLDHHEINGRYMINNRIGVMLNLGYERFGFYTKGKPMVFSNYLNPTIQSVINIGDILKVHTMAKNRLGLLLHFGGGMGFLWQKTPVDDLDKVVSGVIGITPQVRLHDHWALWGDVSLNADYFQNARYDFSSKKIPAVKKPKLDPNNPNKYNNDMMKYLNYKMQTANPLNKINGGVYVAVALGVTYYIGKHKSHADWTPTTYFEGSNDEGALKTKKTKEDKGSEDKKANKSEAVNLQPLEERVTKLEKAVSDDDGDGIINTIDQEANTAEGADVNRYGVTTKVEENSDDSKGSRGDIKVIREMAEQIYFETGKNDIKQSSFSALNKLASIMKNNSNIKISIDGYTDNTGGEAINNKLSQGRADAVKNYLVARGIATDRIQAKGHGASNPIADNSTAIGREQNRRVEITTGNFTQTLKVTE